MDTEQKKILITAMSALEISLVQLDYSIEDLDKQRVSIGKQRDEIFNKLVILRKMLEIQDN